jgi:hypothetical protein
METAANVLRKVFPAVLLLCLAVSGCGTTCVSGIFNGPTSSVGVSNISCPLTKAMGAVTVQFSVASVPSTNTAVFPPPLASLHASQGTSRNNVQHILVTFRGIEAHPDMAADEDSPAWQELAPDLSAHPVQVDLLASSSLTGDSRSLGSPADAIVPAVLPADEYRQMRFWLLPRNPSPDDPVPESNACGDVGWNCIVFADRSTRPLEFPHSEFAAASVRQLGFGPAPQFHIPLEHGAASLFRLLPGEVIHLSIEFDAAASVYFASDAAVHLVPVFRVVSRRSSPAP